MNQSFSECICRHGNLVVADIVDEDQVVNRRAGNRSSMLFGATALFSKPGQSIAPMVGWGLLNFQWIGQGDNPQTLLFSMLYLVPLLCGIFQYAAWSRYTLRGSYLSGVKESIAKDLELCQSI